MGTRGGRGSTVGGVASSASVARGLGVRPRAATRVYAGGVSRDQVVVSDGGRRLSVPPATIQRALDLTQGVGLPDRVVVSDPPNRIFIAVNRRQIVEMENVARTIRARTGSPARKTT